MTAAIPFRRDETDDPCAMDDKSRKQLLADESLGLGQRVPRYPFESPVLSLRLCSIPLGGRAASRRCWLSGGPRAPADPELRELVLAAEYRHIRPWNLFFLWDGFLPGLNEFLGNPPPRPLGISRSEAGDRRILQRLNQRQVGADRRLIRQIFSGIECDL